MARKDQHSPEMDQCDICGAVLDDDSIIQEFPDGSVVMLCGQCASEAVGEDRGPAIDEPKLDRVDHREYDSHLDEATVEWSGPDQQPQGADPGVSGVEAELAAWASAPHENVYASDDDYELSADYDEHDAEEAAHELAAALAQADMADAEREAHGVEGASEEFEAEEIEWVDEAPPGPPSLPTESGTPMPPLPTGAGVPVPPPLPVSTGPVPVPPPLPTAPSVEAPEAQVEHEPEPLAAAEEQTDEHAAEQAEATSDQEQKPAAAAEEAEKQAEDTASEQPAGDNGAATPVSDLIALRTEMQTALSRLSSTLEHFVEEIAASEEKTKAMSDRLHDLEDELDSTRERLRIAEGLPPESEASPAEAEASEKAEDAEPVPEATAGQKKNAAVVPPPLTGPAGPSGAPVPPPLPGAGTPGTAKPAGKGPSGAGSTPGKGATPGTPSAPSAGATPPSLPPKAMGTPRTPSGAAAAGAAAGAAGAAAKAVGGAMSAAAAAGAPPPIPAAGTAQAASSAVAGAAAAVGKLFRGRKDRDEPEDEPEVEPRPLDSGLAFNIHELQAAQRYFNTSEFVKKVRDISRSIGRPQANLSRVSPNEPLAAVTIFWDIVWYQYLIDLRKELPPEDTRVWLDGEGMDLNELEPRFTQKNANVNDDGRVDASLMEIDLLSDPSTVIEEEPSDPAEARLAEDATEEIWDHRSAPDFRWD